MPEAAILDNDQGDKAMPGETYYVTYTINHVTWSVGRQRTQGTQHGLWIFRRTDLGFLFNTVASSTYSLITNNNKNESDPQSNHQIQASSLPVLTVQLYNQLPRRDKQKYLHADSLGLTKKLGYVVR